MMILAVLMNLAALAIFYIEIEIQILLVMLLTSNISYNISL